MVVIAKLFQELLAGGSKRSEFSVEELGGECRRNGYAIPQMQFSRKEKEK